MLLIFITTLLLSIPAQAHGPFMNCWPNSNNFGPLFTDVNATYTDLLDAFSSSTLADVLLGTNEWTQLACSGEASVEVYNNNNNEPITIKAEFLPWPVEWILRFCNSEIGKQDRRYGEVIQWGVSGSMNWTLVVKMVDSCSS